MTTSHHDPPPCSGDPPAVDVDRIAAELAALGEEPADDDELRFVSMTASDVLADGHVEPDVRTVATLVELSTWTPPAEGLLPLERHRVWQRVAQHVPAPVIDPAEPAANSSQGWRGLVAGLALVAGVILMPRFDSVPPAPTEEQRATTASVGEAARAVLDTLPGEQDATRARSLADGYAARLQANRGDTP